MTMKRVIILLLILFGAWKLHTLPGSVTLGPGVHAGQAPSQTPGNPQNGFRHGDYTITPMAGFRIRAKVLSREDYRFDREAELSPVDLALGWGNMSDEDVLAQIEISQGGRWYRWRSESLPIPVREIETHSANMHLIPADEQVESEIRKVRAGEVIELSGSLVEVRAKDGWRWKSSLTREDTGANACEVIWVEEFLVVQP
jgi:hypothetical protein